MTRELVIRAEAQEELAEAFAWYEKQRPGLGADLLLSLEATLADIRRRPGSFPVVYKELHRALLKRFPYGVYFVVEEAFISVLAIFHAKRDPRIWKQRADRR
jgi:plasmid stabilization system protein ParE